MRPRSSALFAIGLFNLTVLDAALVPSTATSRYRYPRGGAPSLKSDDPFRGAGPTSLSTPSEEAASSTGNFGDGRCRAKPLLHPGPCLTSMRHFHRQLPQLKTPAPNSSGLSPPLAPIFRRFPSRGAKAIALTTADQHMADLVKLQLIVDQATPS